MSRKRTEIINPDREEVERLLRIRSLIPRTGNA